MQAEASEQAVRVVRTVRVGSVRVVQAERVVRAVRVDSVRVVQAERVVPAERVGRVEGWCKQSNMQIA